MIERYFTKDYLPKESPEGFQDLPDAIFDWKDVNVTLKDQDGNVIFEQEDCEFPEHYSQTACDIIASKYFYRGCYENSLYDVFARMVWFWQKSLIDENVLTKEEAEVFGQEISYLLYSQMWAPNSPQWFNAGLERSDEDKDALFYYDTDIDSAFPCTNKTGTAQVSACYILDVNDSLIGKGSISDHYVTETKLFKGGSGCGTNFSPLRARGEKLSGGGTSSGLMSFLKGLDVNAGTIKSGGTNRRAAKMVVVNYDHPEIEEFINWKVKEERKAKVLGEAGYDMSIGGEAYSTVAGQNSNNSVRVDDKFMEALKNDDEVTLTGRKDKSINRKISAKKLFTEIAEAAWECGDPGIQFDDTFNKWNTCKESGRINATNPCSEFAFLDNTACNLSSINLEKFVTDKQFDLNGFYHTVRLAQLAMEASIYSGCYPTPEIARNSYRFRPTGLGITGLAGFFEKLGIAYDSEEARTWAGAITSFMTAVSYKMSGEIAERVGAFPEWEKNKNSMNEVILMHAEAAENLKRDNQNPILNLLIDRTLNRWKDVSEFYTNGIGYRNAQVTCIAPTGTISLAMDATSTGIEPYYSRTVYKKLADGTTITQENDVIKTADEIDPIDHVKMVAAIQPHISGAISKTVNLPNTATVGDISDVFIKAYELGCKSITVYRDGSKGTQVLNTKKVYKRGDTNYKLIAPNGDEGWLVRKEDLIKAAKKYHEQQPPIRRKPDGIRLSKTHSAKIGDIQLYITVGFYDDGKIAEIFVNTDKQGEVVNGLLDSLSKALSHLIQYGVKPEEISKILRGQKYEPSGVVERHPNIKLADSVSDLISKIIDIEVGDYLRVQIKPDEIPTETVETEKSERVYDRVCSVCGSTHLLKTGSCHVCQDCGTTTGCS